MEQAVLARPRARERATLEPQVFPSADHARALRESYRALEPALDLVASLFYHRLETLAPQVRAMLPGGPGEQRRQFKTSLSLAIASLDRLGDIHPALRLLGAKFAARGAAELHYGVICEALCWTLAQSLGGQWTPETADAWTAFCTEIAEVMTASRQA